MGGFAGRIKVHGGRRLIHGNKVDGRDMMLYTIGCVQAQLAWLCRLLNVISLMVGRLFMLVGSQNCNQ